MSARAGHQAIIAVARSCKLCTWWFSCTPVVACSGYCLTPLCNCLVARQQWRAWAASRLGGTSSQHRSTYSSFGIKGYQVIPNECKQSRFTTYQVSTLGLFMSRFRKQSHVLLPRIVTSILHLKISQLGKTIYLYSSRSSRS